MNQPKKKVFIAGATGAIGKRLSQILVSEGYQVFGTTRKADRKQSLETLGVVPVVVDVFDRETLETVLNQVKPEIVIHQLTDLPFALDPEQMQAALVRNARLRKVGTQHLVQAATQAGVRKMIAQSIAFVYEPGPLPHNETSPLLNFKDPVYGETSEAVASLEQQVLEANLEGIILRYGMLFGPGTGFENPIDAVPCVHVDAAAHAALLAIRCPTLGIYNVAIKDERLSTDKAITQLGWDEHFRIEA